MHFTGRVFLKQNNIPTEEDLYPVLEQYWENTEKREYNEFVDCTDEVNQKWLEVKEEGKFKNIEDLASEWFGFVKVGSKFGYYHNPQAHWDWFQIGGRWAGEQDIVKAKDFKLDTSTPEDREDLRKMWKLLTCKEDWNDNQRNLADSLGIVARIYNAEYYINKYGTEDAYVESQCKNYPYCFVDTNGDWNQPGEIGWFIDDVESDGLEKYHRAFVDELEKAKASDETVWLVNVDFHI